MCKLALLVDCAILVAACSRADVSVIELEHWNMRQMSGQLERLVCVAPVAALVAPVHQRRVRLAATERNDREQSTNSNDVHRYDEQRAASQIACARACVQRLV